MTNTEIATGLRRWADTSDDLPATNRNLLIWAADRLEADEWILNDPNVTLS